MGSGRFESARPYHSSALYRISARLIPIVIGYFRQLGSGLQPPLAANLGVLKTLSLFSGFRNNGRNICGPVVLVEGYEGKKGREDMSCFAGVTVLRHNLGADFQIGRASCRERGQ